MNFKMKGWGQAVLAVCFSVTAGQAAVLGTYSDRASWEAVVTAGTRVDVPFAGPSSFSTGSTPTSDGGASFLGFYNEPGPVGYLTYRQNQSSIDASLNLGSFGFIMIGGGATSSSVYSAGLNMSPAASSRAVGFDFGAYNEFSTGMISNSTSATTFLIRVFEGAGNMTGEYEVNGVNRPSLGFFGVATSGDISGVSIYSKNESGAGWKTFTFVDNFSYGATTLSGGGDPPPSGGDVPEPGTYALAGLGLLGMVLLRRKF
jgi:hypothetical protein